jgi:hypothetical protein
MDLTALTLYVGLGLGAGNTKAPYPTYGVFGKRDTSSVVAAGFAGVRMRYLGIEGGLLSLPRLSADVTVPDYPAYSLVNFGNVVEAPSSVAGTHEITSHARYLRMNVYGPELWKVIPYAFIGKASVHTTNVEHATYTGPDEIADFRISFNQSARYWGAGLETGLSVHWSVRAEAGFIPSAVQSYWTRERDVSMGKVSATLRW